MLIANQTSAWKGSTRDVTRHTPTPTLGHVERVFRVPRVVRAFVREIERTELSFQYFHRIK